MFRTTRIESVFPVQSSQSVCVLLCSIHRSHAIQSNDVGCRKLLNQNSFEVRSRRIFVFALRVQSNATRPVFRNRVSVLFSTSTLPVCAHVVCGDTSACARYLCTNALFTSTGGGCNIFHVPDDIATFCARNRFGCVRERSPSTFAVRTLNLSGSIAPSIRTSYCRRCTSTAKVDNSFVQQAAQQNYSVPHVPTTVANNKFARTQLPSCSHH
jgi:hypothetical protein